MVVTVKYNNKPKIVIFALAAILLAAAGVFTGVSLIRGKTDGNPPASVGEDNRTYGWQRGQEKQQEIEKKFSD
jgi:hypothetical protein